MSVDGVKNISAVSSAPPAADARRDFVPREGQVYSAKVKGFADGAALVSIEGRFLLSLADIALKAGEVINLKLIRRDADGKLIFKLADSPAEGQLTARERTPADILKSIGADAKNPQAAAVLDSHLRFGMKLDAGSIDRIATALDRALSASPEAGAVEAESSSARPAAKPNNSSGAEAGSARPFDARRALQALADAATLLSRSGAPVSPDSLKLAASLIEAFTGPRAVNFSRVLSGAHPALAAVLARLAAEFERAGNRAAAASARRAFEKVSASRSFENGALKIFSALAGLQVGQASRGGAEDAPAKAAELIKDLLAVLGELEKNAPAGLQAQREGPGAFSRADARESLAAAIEGRAMAELYSAISGCELFKLPFTYDGEGHEALCAVESEDGRAAAIDMYLTLSGLGDVRVNIKKKASAAGIYIFVETADIKKFIEEKYAAGREAIDAAMNASYYFSVVVGRRIDFMPPVFKNHVAAPPAFGAGVDVSA